MAGWGAVHAAALTLRSSANALWNCWAEDGAAGKEGQARVAGDTPDLSFSAGESVAYGVRLVPILSSHRPHARVRNRHAQRKEPRRQDGAGARAHALARVNLACPFPWLFAAQLATRVPTGALAVVGAQYVFEE